jgi:CRP/FNR family transcriptional regulator, cyclic AMP receptor protein
MQDIATDTTEAVIAATFLCDPEVARAVAACARYRDHPARTTIIESGVASDGLYLIVSGKARMLAYSIDGRLLVVEELTSGDLFGEMSLFDGQPMAGEVSATAITRTGLFEAHVFLGLMTRYSAIALAISRILVSRLGAARQRLVEGVTLSAAGRIHAELLRQARAGEAMTIRPAPVLAAFALSVQSTRESVSRAINALQKRGIIRRDADSLTVVAPHRLEELIY